jgi:predicted nucleotidyltransferase
MLKKAQDIKEIIERFKQELRKFNINSDKIILYGSYDMLKVPVRR